MIMKSKTIQVYSWDDIQTEICKEMGLDENYFRDYHKVIGGEYKDLWHEWLNYFDSNIINGDIKHNDIGESFESKLEWVKEDGKDWLEPFLVTVYNVWNEYKIEYVEYYW